MKHLAVKLCWGLLSQFIRQLTTLRFNDVCLSRRNTISLRIVTLANTLLNSLLMRPGRILVLDQSLRRRLVLSLRAWHVVAVEDVVDSGHRGVRSRTAGSSGDHFVHDLLKFLLHFLRLLAQVNVSNLGLAALVPENALDICY